jgi:DNA-3-methyladenine glycosylase II
MKNRNQNILAGMDHLTRNDRQLSKVINNVGEFKIRLDKNRFRMLVRSVVSQQLSTKVAKTINIRLNDLVDNQLTPDSIQSLSIKDIRSVGLSERKAVCILSLAGHIAQNDIPLRNIGRLSNEEIISRLTIVKGIGEWTAQMFLMFSLGRLDVLPHGDLGVRTGIQKIYSLDELPGKEIIHEIAENWHPYSSIASWYCWKYLDLEW